MNDTQLDNLKKSAQLLTSALDSITNAMTDGDKRLDYVMEAKRKAHMSLAALSAAMEGSITNPTWNFVEQCCDLSSMDSTVSSKVIYERFQEWCYDHHIKCDNQATFAKNLFSIIPDLRREPVDGEATFKGIKLKD